MPSPELADYTEAAAERWSRATGRDFVVGTSGVAVEYGEADGDCGTTTVVRTRKTNRVVSIGPIEISTDLASRRCTLPDVVLLHEMGHAIAPLGDHSDGGLMARASNSHATRIDEVSLTWVCSQVYCPAFNPELP